MIEFTVNEKLKGTKIGQWLLHGFQRREKREFIQKEHLESRVHSISLIYHFVFHYINQAAMNWQSIKTVLILPTL